MLILHDILAEVGMICTIVFFQWLFIISICLLNFLQNHYFLRLHRSLSLGCVVFTWLSLLFWMPRLLLLVFTVTGVLWWKSLYIYPCPPYYLCPWKVKVLVAQLCPTLWDTVNCSPAGFSVCEIFQARILEWGAIPFSRGPSRPRDWTRGSCIAGRFFTVWATREALTMSLWWI